jgi:glycosyltransferase involved in cell wall biosynthesis/2-polyprenyl-3-methyl-5-hydroxy-6-metoxy-1,4-benzoquinol methylase
MFPQDSKPLIFIVAYNAEAHLESVFKRIPYERLPAGCEVIVIDDASPDSTFEVGKRAALTCPVPVRVLKNPKNLGYGGNQKLGYQIAIEEGFTAVALLHGDGQYAPELLPEIFAPILNDGADVVLGSRMLRKKDALAGGMPFYKWVGNQILTKIENRMLGAQLSEFHTGYRAYRVAALERIPFHFNTNNFHFDTDILIQFLRIGGSIREIPIPTFYGDEVCHVNGWKYFFDCIRSCTHDWLTKKGIFYCRRFDLTPPGGRYESKIGLIESSQTLAVNLVTPGSRVLDIGGGNSWVADYLAKNKGCSITIIDSDFRHTPPISHRTIDHSFSAPISFKIPECDVVMLLDIIEHIPRQNHVALLDRLRKHLDSPPVKMIISVPNTAFLPLRVVFMLLGRLNYGRRGILDDTHAFLFTKSSLKELMETCGYEIQRWHYTPAPYELALGQTKLSRILSKLNSSAASILPSLFAYQHVIEVSPRPTVATLISRCFENSNCPRSVASNSPETPSIRTAPLTVI